MTNETTYKPLNEQTIFITGANGGIALATIKELLHKNTKHLILVCRNENAVTKLKQELKSHIKNTSIEYYSGFDMTDLNKIKQAVKNLKPKYKIDTVFLQAGGMIVANDFQFITDHEHKIERSIYQNVLGGYAVVKFLKEFNLIQNKTRFVFQGGEGARGLPGVIKKPEFHNQQEFLDYVHTGSHKEKYSDVQALGHSKFTSALLVQQLSELNDNHEYIWFSPGFTAGTNGLKEVAQPKRFIMEKIGFPILTFFGKAQLPKQAGEKNVLCLSGKIGKNGDLIGAPEGKGIGKLVDQKPMNPSLTNLPVREAFWQLSNDIVNQY